PRAPRGASHGSIEQIAVMQIAVDERERLVLIWLLLAWHRSRSAESYYCFLLEMAASHRFLWCPAKKNCHSEPASWQSAARSRGLVTACSDATMDFCIFPSMPGVDKEPIL